MSSPRITTNDLKIAIETNLTGIVKSYLSSGGNPNANIWIPDKFPIDEHLVLAEPSSSCTISAIHVSTFSCIRIVKKGTWEEWEHAIDILDLLIAAGANVNLQVRVAGHGHVSPLSLTLLVIEKLNRTNNTYAIQRDGLVLLTEKLMPSPSALLFPKSIPTVTMIPQSVANTYKNLLLSSNQSDIQFVCSDGEILPAHKIILAAASPYFETAFDGPWAENTPKGEWHTKHPSSLIKAVLTYIYTGDVSDSVAGETFMDMLSIAGEYNLPSLTELAAFHCIRSMSVANFKKMAQLAYIHGIENLKKACCEFLKTNKVAILKNPNVMSLPTESPDLWAELTAGIAP
jgi:hypothetical protein